MTSSELAVSPSPDAPAESGGIQRPRSWLGYRHLMTFLVFLATTVGYAMRVDLSIAVVAMVNNTENPDFEEFDWDSTTRNTILSSFFWGYVVTQVPSGLFAQMFGAKWLLFSGVAVSSIATILTPVAASYGGWGAVCATRVIAGLSQGTLFPSLHSMLSKWAPPDERGKFAAVAFSGSQVGTVIALPIGGLLVVSKGGWPSIFYVFGGLGLLWCVIWFLLAASNPAEHPYISKEEKEYIQLSIAEKSKKVSIKTPWKSLFTSGPMWAVILAHCTQNWGFWILMTEMPTYMKNVLNFDIKENGALSAVPYLAMAILSYVFGGVADFAFRRGWITLTFSRKLFNSIGFWGPAAALCGLSFINKEEITLGVVLLVFSVGLNAGCYVGFQVNHIDLSPNFASTMMGITNGVSNLFSIVGPLVVGVVVTDETSSAQWRIIFLVTAGVYTCGNILYLILATSEKQPWDDPDYCKGNDCDESVKDDPITTTEKMDKV